MSYSISSPARFCKERNVFETLDVILDIENGKIELASEDKKDVIRLDLNGVAVLEDILRNITKSKPFQNALQKYISEYIGRLNAVDGAIP